MFLEGLFFKILRTISRSFFHALALRPGSDPFLTGDSFRKLANHRHDETTSLNPTLVKTGDIVFVSSPRMKEYFLTIHPQIAHRYILVQHNGDMMVDDEIATFIDDKIIIFYAQIVLAAHPKIIPIPIGIENKHHGNEVLPFLLNLAKRTAQKRPHIFYHFSVQTNPPERGPALTYFKTHPLLETISTFVPYWSYKKILASYAFTVSPAGNTLGSHRTWEALYLRTIPIVKRTVDAEACVALGLPLWIVDDWSELEQQTEATLATRYDAMMKQASFEALDMHYWRKRILGSQQEARAGTPR